MSTLIQRAFSSGELSPSLYSRVDHVRYQTGLKTCRNFIVKKSGGVDNRPGTEFICEASFAASSEVRLVPFVFSSTQTYMLLFGFEYIRFIKNGTLILYNRTLFGGTITGISMGTTTRVTIATHHLINGQEVVLSQLSTIPGLNNRHFKVSNKTVDTFDLLEMDGVTSFDSTGFPAWTSGGIADRPYEVSTSYDDGDLAALQFVQSADVMTFVHPSHPPANLSRIADDSWTFANINFAPGIIAPTGVAAAPVGTRESYVITSIASGTFEESLPSAVASANGVATPAASHNVTWNAVSGADSYNVYKSSVGDGTTTPPVDNTQGIYGFVGNVIGTTFIDYGITPADLTTTAPIARNPFGSTDNYPAAVAYIQQRLAMGGTNSKPETIELSRTGFFYNFTKTYPSQDDNSISFNLIGSQINAVKHLLELRKPIIFTQEGEWILNGNDADIIIPTAINPKKQSYNGSSDLAPLAIDSTALYVQGRGNQVRDLGFEFQIDGYRGNDLSIFATHLFDLYTLDDWTYQKIPNSIVWAVRSDGTLLGLTYIREQQILGWHRHDFDGTVVNVASIPEGEEDSVYLAIQRDIDGVSKTYIERMYTRVIDDIIDAVFLDCVLGFDGTGGDGTLSSTLSLSGGTNWDQTETITITNEDPNFTSAKYTGNEVHITGSDGTVIRFTDIVYVSSTVLTGKPHKTIPASMRDGVPLSPWSRAVDHVDGLWHLEGEDVGVFADGFVVASPNNSRYDTITVTNGAIDLPKCYAVISVGLPITADLETLDIDTVQGETIVDKDKLVQKVTMRVDSSRGIFVGGEEPDSDGDALDGLQELQLRNLEDYDSPTDLKSDNVNVIIRSEWNSNGRIFIRQVDPLPLSILSVAPAGLFPFKAGG